MRASRRSRARRYRSRRPTISPMSFTPRHHGHPEGVAVRHCNVTALMQSRPGGLAPGGVWSQCHSLAFDFSVWEIFGPLLSGGRVVVVPESVVRSAEELHALLVAEQVTVLSQTPSAVGMLSPVGLESTSLMIAAEPCPVEVGGSVGAGSGDGQRYGPTETTVYATISAPLRARSGSVPIGSPVALAALWVLDGWLRPVARGGG